MNKQSLFAAVLCALANVSFNPASAQTEVDDYIRAIEGVQVQSAERLGSFTVEELLRELDVPGVSIAVVKDFRIHWAKGYGIADVNTGQPVDVDTKFQAASFSKALNGMALVKAAQDGLIDLDQDINNYLKSWQVPQSEFTAQRPVTARMLAGHIAGLGDGLGFRVMRLMNRYPH